jgi:hypothetical protein
MENSARAAFATVAQTLDKQQRLMLQRHKSRIYRRTEVHQLASRMIEDQPVSEDEADLLTHSEEVFGRQPLPHGLVW